MEKHDKVWFGAVTACTVLIAAAALIIRGSRSPEKPIEITVYTAPADSEAANRQQTAVTEPTAVRTAAATEEKTAAVPVTKETYTQTTAPERNLNTADAAALRRVSGVGDILAAEIIRYRTEIGGFRRRSELLDVPGIGEVLAERIMEEFEIPGELPPAETTVTTHTTTARTTVRTSARTEINETETTDSGIHPVCDINKVTRDELLQIPEMTEEMADALLEFRGKIGAFQSVYELAALEGFSGSYVQHVCMAYLFAENDPAAGNEKSGITG